MNVARERFDGLSLSFLRCHPVGEIVIHVAVLVQLTLLSVVGEAEIEQMIVQPSHAFLNDDVQIQERVRGGHLYQSPAQRIPVST